MHVTIRLRAIHINICCGEFNYLVGVRVGQPVQQHLVVVFGHMRQRQHVTVRVCGMRRIVCSLNRLAFRSHWHCDTFRRDI